MKNALLIISLFTLLASCASAASYVNVLQPFNTTIYANGSIILGDDGPGQTFYVTISSLTVNSTGANYTYGWNELYATDVPQGWIVKNSSLNNAQLSVEITPPATTQSGTYYFNLTAINLGNYSKLGKVEFKTIVNVNPDVFKMTVTPTNISTGPDQPTSIVVTINNTGVSDSPFLINVQGLPGWNQTNAQTVIALHHTSENFSYPVFENTSGIYHVVVNVSSSQSPLIFKRSNVTLAVQVSVLNDYKALSQGAIAFPIIFEPIYAVMQLIGELLKAL